jgi:hypothetical protein
MNKSFNKYKKSRWTKTRLSNRHKARLAMRKMQAALVIAQSLANINQIRFSMSLNKVGKAAAIVAVAFNAFVTASKTLKVKGE